MRTAFMLGLTVVAAGCATDGGGAWRALPPGPPAIVSFDPPRVPASAPSTAPADPPSFATKGWKKPRLKVERCLEDSVLVPQELSGYASGPVVVKFAILKSGEPAQYSVLTSGVPDRLQEAIWGAVRSCGWLPGADPGGNPANVWVIQPLRFANGW